MQREEGSSMQSEEIVAKARGDLQRAERNIEDFRNRLQNAERDVAEISAFLRLFDHYAGPVRQDEAERPKRPYGGVRAPAREGAKSRRLVDESLNVIDAAKGRRVDIRELLNSILEAGLEIGGRDEKSNLAGYLSRDERVNYVRGEGWGRVKEEATDPATNQEVASSQSTGGTDEGTTPELPGIDGS